jgi:hypothetical protein
MLPGSGADADQRQFFVNACYGAGIGVGNSPEANLAYVLANIPGYTRVSDATVGDDEPSQSGNQGVFPEPANSQVTSQNTQGTQAQVAQVAQAAQEQAAAALKYAHDNPLAYLSPNNPLGLPPGVGPRVGLSGLFPEDKDPNQKPTMSPWVKWSLIIAGVGAGGYALSQVASVGHVIRGR